jgi:hypothetical protein
MDKARLKQGVRVHRPDLPGDPHGTITRERLSGRWRIQWDHLGTNTMFPSTEICSVLMDGEGADTP